MYKYLKLDLFYNYFLKFFRIDKKYVCIESKKSKYKLIEIYKCNLKTNPFTITSE